MANCGIVCDFMTQCTYYKSSDELYHYGVLGMKWGRRKAKDSTSKTTWKQKHGQKKIAKSLDVLSEVEKQHAIKARKRHLGIDTHGNINITKEKTTKKNAAKFALKTGITLSGVALSVYLSKHPEVVMKGIDAFDKILKKNSAKKVSDIAISASSNSGIYSKSLGRMLTVEEVIAKGFGEYL